MQPYNRPAAAITLSLLSTFALGGTLADAASAQSVTYSEAFTVFADLPLSNLGTAVAGGRDQNGDGVPDPLVGNVGIVGQGATTGNARIVSGVDGSTLVRVQTTAALDGYATTLDAIDYNGDGIDDLLVGAPTRDVGTIDSAGFISVYSGVDGSVLFDRNGTLKDGLFGSDVASLGDLDGDGNEEFIVGAPGANNAAYVFSGGTGQVRFTLERAGVGRVGETVSSAGDVNGDSVADLIVGDGNRDSASVFSGSDGSLLYVVDPGVSPTGNVEQIAPLGDFNGDGFDDFAMGQVLYSGIDGAVITTLSTIRNSSLEVIGDLNFDGVADLLSSSPGGPTDSGSVIVTSGADNSILVELMGDAGDQFGTSVANAGDLNGDGIDDIIVGATDGGDFDRGYLRVYYSTVVPEPAALALPMVGLLALRRRRVGS